MKWVKSVFFAAFIQPFWAKTAYDISEVIGGISH